MCHFSVGSPAPMPSLRGCRCHTIHLSEGSVDAGDFFCPRPRVTRGSRGTVAPPRFREALHTRTPGVWPPRNSTLSAQSGNKPSAYEIPSEIIRRHRSGYRGPQQATSGVPDKDRPTPCPLHDSNPRRNAKNGHKTTIVSDTGVTDKGTGVPDKNYRGPRQKLPGSPTKTTGVPDKNYRGPQQGRFYNFLQKRGFLAFVSFPLYCYCLCFVV